MTPDFYLGPPDLSPADIVSSGRPFASLPDEEGTYQTPLTEIRLTKDGATNIRVQIPASKIDETINLSGSPHAVPLASRQLVITKNSRSR